MAVRKDISPRKSPTQRRSRETVSRIIDAAARVLAERGYDGASTNRIAEAAGISSGSLYQYFPNKDAIVLAVVDRFADQLTERINAQLDISMAGSWQEGGRALLAAQFEVFEEHLGPLRTVLEQIPQLVDTDKLAALNRRMADLTRLYLIAHRREFRAELDIEATVWILVEVSSQLAIRYLVRRPPISKDLLINELTTLFTRYLTD